MPSKNVPSVLRGSSKLALSEDLEQRMQELLALGQREQQSTLDEWIREEYALDDRELRAFTLARLRALLNLAANNPDNALRIAAGYDAAFERLPAATAMRRVMIVQTVARSELERDELLRLQELVPSILRQLPRPAALQPLDMYRAAAEARRGRRLRALRRYAVRLNALWRRRRPAV